MLEHDRLHRIGRLLRFVEDLEDPLRRGRRRLEHVGHARHLGDGLRELLRVLDEGLYVAQRHGAARHPQSADHAMATYCRLPMKIMAGQMMPEMNCALKLAW